VYDIKPVVDTVPPSCIRLVVELPPSYARANLAAPVGGDTETPMDHESSVDQRAQMAQLQRQPYSIKRALADMTCEEMVSRCNRVVAKPL
jgi:hypothetical protein